MARPKSDTTELKKKLKEYEQLIHHDGLVIAKLQKIVYKGIKEVREGIANDGLDNWADSAESVLNTIARDNTKATIKSMVEYEK